MSEAELKLSPTRPYMARAIYEWICDNQLTPYILVDVAVPFTLVPEQYIKDGQIVLNLAPHAVHAFQMSNDAISFSARFGGVSRQIHIPFAALLGIYARENGQGLFFDPNEYTNIQNSQDELESPAEEKPQSTKKKLRLLD